MPVAAQGGAMTNGQPRPQLADDLLVGLQAIAEFTGISVRRVTYAVEQGRIPTFRLGKTVCARRSEIDAALRASAAAGTAA